jgi:hypothetical protein
LISQGGDWALNIIGDCPGNWGRYYILQKMAKILISKEGMIEKEGK